mmetsp:Transcript_36109/g.97789  ORF Transcript_36109/g.97789 Transcript_36109/m.97789 type:complete len:150 (-) Transcript_36109:130-579(-)
MYAEQDRLAPAQRAAAAAKELFQELGDAEGLQNAEWYVEWFAQVAEQWAEQERLQQQQQRGRGGRSSGVRPFGGGVGGGADTRVVIDSTGRPVRGGGQGADRAERSSRFGGGPNVNSSELYNRKAFPWTSQQKEEVKPEQQPPQPPQRR